MVLRGIEPTPGFFPGFYVFPNFFSGGNTGVPNQKRMTSSTSINFTDNDLEFQRKFLFNEKRFLDFLLKT